VDELHTTRLFRIAASGDRARILRGFIVRRARRFDPGVTSRNVWTLITTDRRGQVDLVGQEVHVVTGNVLDRGRAAQVAERLEHDNPDWVVMYGSYSREFVAFPVYPDAPDNSYCSAKDPAALDGHIRETERRHGRVRLIRSRRRAGVRPAGRTA
jgi:hypothetical protein